MISDSLRLLNNDGHPTHVAVTYLFITKWQFRLLSLFPPIVASFSVFGAVAILYRILKIDRHEYDANTRRTYHRLLVALSICELVGCIGLMFGTAPVPRETLLEFARGNTATCTAQGFFVETFYISVLFYDAGIMIYFLLTIRYNWTEQQVTKRVEPFVHVVALLFPLAVGLAAISLEAINPAGFGPICGFGPYPLFCYADNTCTRGQAGTVIFFFFVIIPATILLLILYVSITLIYCSVRSQGRRALAITSNRDQILARTRAVAVQSWLFAALFFCTWFQPPLNGLLGAAVTDIQVFSKVQYALAVTEVIFLPMHGFLTFCIYIRPRFIRFRRHENLSFWSAVKIAAFGGRETILTRRRSSMMNRRRGSSTTTQGHLLSVSLAIRQPLPTPGKDDEGSGRPRCGSKQVDHDLTDNDDELAGAEIDQGSNLPFVSGRDSLVSDVVALKTHTHEPIDPHTCMRSSCSLESVQDDLTEKGTKLEQQDHLADVEHENELIRTNVDHEPPDALSGGDSDDLVSDVPAAGRQQMQQQQPTGTEQGETYVP